MMTNRAYNKLRYARHCTGQSGEVFGAHCGVPARYISRAECGYGMSELHLQRVADYLGWKGDIHELLEPVEPLQEVTAPCLTC